MKPTCSRLSTLLTTVALVSVLCHVSARAGDYTYTTNNAGTITITRYYGPGGDVIIPGEINGLPVMDIGDSAFSGCTSLTSVVIPDSVTYIGAWAFSGCTDLTSVVIPDSVTSIGYEAFYDCISLTGVYFAGNAPQPDGYQIGDGPLATVYYLPSTTGWGSTFAGWPTALWTQPLLSAGSIQADGNGFGFTISWAPNATLVVEACSDLANPSWSGIATNAPSSGTWMFSDPEGRSHPNRFYRVRSP